MPIHTPKSAPDAAGLDRLLALEAELGGRLQSARVEADRIRREAEAGATAARVRGEAAALAEEEAVARRLAGERDLALEGLRAEAVQRVARIGRLDDTRVEALARGVLVRLLEAGPKGAAQ